MVLLNSIGRTHQTNMHHCLQITEILLKIFQYVHSDVVADWQPDPNLYHLALTCKTFQEPALDELWGYHGYPLKLFQTLPHDSWQMVGRRRTSSLLQNLKIVSLLVHNRISYEDYAL